MKNNLIIRSIFFIAKTIAVLFVVGIFSIILVQRVFNNNVSLFGYRIFTVVTQSMEPDYMVSDIIISKNVDTNTLKVGDDVVYLGKVGTFENKIVTHRIIEIVENDGPKEFYTQGINNTGVDPVVTEDQIYGVVLGKSSILSFLSKLVSTPFGFMLLVLLPGSILIATEIFDKFNEKEEE